jgi:hypothetical protein
MSGKWVDLLKQIVPSVTRAAVLRNPNSAAGIGQFAAIQSAAQTRWGLNSCRTACATPARSRAASRRSRASGLDYRKDDIIRVAQQLLSKLPR